MVKITPYIPAEKHLLTVFACVFTLLMAPFAVANAPSKVDVTSPQTAVYASILMSLVEDAGDVRARAYVELIDASNQPVGSARVFARFSTTTGDTFVEAESNDVGVVLLSSDAGSIDTVWSFSVDYVIQNAASGQAGTGGMPRSFVRVGRTFFSHMSVFSTTRINGDSGTISDAGVSPFVLAIPADELALLGEAGAGPGLFDATATPVESLMMRNFSPMQGGAPSARVAARSAVASHCLFADSPVLAVHVLDAGVSPFAPLDAGVSPFTPEDAGVSPFTPEDAGVSPFSRLTSPSGDSGSIIVRGESGLIRYYLENQPVELSELGATVATAGVVTVGLAENDCTHTSWLVSDASRFPAKDTQGEIHWDVVLRSEPEATNGDDLAWQSTWGDIKARATKDGTLANDDQLWQLDLDAFGPSQLAPSGDNGSPSSP